MLVKGATGNKSLPEPVSTKICDTTCHQELMSQKTSNHLQFFNYTFHVNFPTRCLFLSHSVFAILCMIWYCRMFPRIFQIVYFHQLWAVCIHLIQFSFPQGIISHCCLCWPTICIILFPNGFPVWLTKQNVGLSSVFHMITLNREKTNLRLRFNRPWARGVHHALPPPHIPTKLCFSEPSVCPQ